MNSPSETCVTFSAPEQAELLAVPRDTSPLLPTQIAGHTLASLVSAGTELADGYQGKTFPYVPGYAAVFEVEEIGSAVEGIAVGDRVFSMGHHQSWQRAESETVLRLPQNLAPEDAVFARLMSVTMSTLTTTTARPPAPVLVMGLGLVGHLAAKVFTACGYQVWACDPSPSRREFALESGISNVLAEISPETLPVSGRIALALECSGHEGAALAACRVVCKRGEVVLVGTPWRRYTEIYAQDLTHAIFHNYVVLRSGWEWEVPRQPTDFRSNSIRENQEAALQWLAQGRVSVGNLGQKAAPQDAQAVYQDLRHGRLNRLAAIFDWTTASVTSSL